MKLSFSLIPSKQGGGGGRMGAVQRCRVRSALRGKADSECILGAAL